MPVYKDKDRNTWYCVFRYKDFTGKSKQKWKRGFRTKSEALDWERKEKLKKEDNLNMTFKEFCDLYEEDVKFRVKKTTWEMKKNIIDTKILPYFANRKMEDITPKNVRDWQKEMVKLRTPSGKPYASSYLATLQCQLSAIMNHAVRFYGLKRNPTIAAGPMGSKKTKEMLFWTQDEYLRFSECVMDKPMSYYGFQILYWCGLRVGEMLALTPADFDFEKKTVRVNKNYQRVDGQDIIQSPKTIKSIRTVLMPDFLCDEIQDYIKMQYMIKPHQRLFPLTKRYYQHEMERGSELAGVKKIRVHDLRHSHVSLLIELGFSALAIADRMGHESIRITYQYAHLFPKKQLEIVDKLDKLQFENMNDLYEDEDDNEFDF